MLCASQPAARPTTRSSYQAAAASRRCSWRRLGCMVSLITSASERWPVFCDQCRRDRQAASIDPSEMRAESLPVPLERITAEAKGCEHWMVVATAPRANMRTLAGPHDHRQCMWYSGLRGRACRDTCEAEAGLRSSTSGSLATAPRFSPDAATHRPPLDVEAGMTHVSRSRGSLLGNAGHHIRQLLHEGHDPGLQ